MIINNKKIFMKVCLIFLFGIGLRFAYATPSTHIWAPSTDIQPFGRWHITSDIYIPLENDEEGNVLPPVTNLGLTVGILPFERFNMELGFDHKAGLGDLDEYPFYFNAKAGIPEGSFGRFFPAVAIGIYDVGTEHNQTDFNIVYLKIAKSTLLGRFSAGYFSGNSELLLDEEGNVDNEGIFAAWERVMKEISDRLWICVEYMGTESSYGAWSFGFSYKFVDDVSILCGYNIYNNENIADTFTIQVDIDF
ncbi:MAG: hypothetical protein N3D17_07570 [bacterium]|nr:hypothetical protein [bacterium]